MQKISTCWDCWPAGHAMATPLTSLLCVTACQHVHWLLAVKFSSLLLAAVVAVPGGQTVGVKITPVAIFGLLAALCVS